MKLRIHLYFWIMALSLIAAGANASDLEVSDISLSAPKWGNQTVYFKLSNTGEDYKFVTAMAAVHYTSGKYISSRFSKKSYQIEPLSAAKTALPVIIPAGYGGAVVEITLYDVIDTLDQVFESQKFFQKSLPLEFKIPEILIKEVGDEISIPKFVKDNEFFDNYFARAMMYLIGRGKSVKEIAEICGTDSAFVRSTLTNYQTEGYVKAEGTEYKLNFMTVAPEDIKKIAPYIEETVSELFEVVSGNLPAYDSCLSAMIADGRLSADKNDALDMGTVLYHKYPVVMGLFLWDLLGREFVNGGKPFNIFENSDPCMARMGDMMYMATNSGDFVGDTYYYHIYMPKEEMFYCGMGEHNFKCPQNYQDKSRRKQREDWGFDGSRPDLIFIFNADKVREPLSLLLDGTPVLADKLSERMDDIFAGEEYDQFKRGAKYWCWDIVVTKLMRQLEAEKLIKMEDNGIYRFQKIDL